MATRTAQLLEAIAKQHCDLSFIDGSFLDEHNISSYETTVFETAGQIILGFLKLPLSAQAKILALGQGLDPHFADYMQEGLRMGELTDELNRIKL